MPSLRWLLATALLLSVAPAKADFPNLYAAYAASTKAIKTDWRYGYADQRGYVGNFAKTQSVGAILAVETYRADPAEARANLWKDGFYVMKVIELSAGTFGSAEALIAQDLFGRMIVTAIRGTQDNGDAQADAFWFPTLDSSGPVRHKGFVAHTAVLKEPVRSAVEPYCANGTNRRPIWFVGHSLGGAAASLLADYFEKERNCVVNGVVTFGSPRVGMQDWQRRYDSPDSQLYYRSQRWVNELDPVYCAPPGGQWRHVGLEHYVDSQRMTVRNDVYGSVCNTPEGLLRAVKVLSAEPALWIGTRLAGPMRDLSRGLINFVLQCQPGIGWDDLWSLGACAFVDVTGRLSGFYDITPDEFFTEVIRVLNKSDHSSTTYRRRLSNVNFDDNSAQYLFPPGPPVVF